MLAAILKKRFCTYYSFVTKVMCTKFGVERPASHFSQGRPLEMVTILEKKVDEKQHLNTKVAVCQIWLRKSQRSRRSRRTLTHTERQTRLRACTPSALLDPLQVVNKCITILSCKLSLSFDNAPTQG